MYASVCIYIYIYVYKNVRPFVCLSVCPYSSIRGPRRDPVYGSLLWVLYGLLWGFIGFLVYVGASAIRLACTGCILA